MYSVLDMRGKMSFARAVQHKWRKVRNGACRYGSMRVCWRGLYLIALTEKLLIAVGVLPEADC